MGAVGLEPTVFGLRLVTSYYDLEPDALALLGYAPSIEPRSTSLR